MKFCGLLPIAAVTATVLGAIVVLFDVVHMSESDGEPTFSLAPMSLGNPAAAATLQTRSLGQVVDEVFIENGSLPPLPTPIFTTVTVKPGNTLSGLLTSAGLSTIEAAAVVEAFSDAFDPRRIRAGNKINLQFLTHENSDKESGDSTQFIGLEYEPTPLELVLLEQTDIGFTAAKKEKILRVETRQTHGVIDDSLYMAGVRAGLPVPVLIDLIHAYSWDVDFQRDIRKGDAFNILYQSKQDPHGSTVAYGEILYAELNLSGTALPIYRYTTTDGTTDYFDDKGRSAKKTLMRTPIDGARLSSGFGSRKHPILGYNKMHKGVDFAAPRGTPIYAAGDGVIDYAGRNGAYGKYVRIRHNGEYSTAYAHMKGFGSGIGKGKRVRQGQIIGYVGTTGRSTGPHLHYEILKNNKQVNPMKVKMPSGLKLAGAEFERFQKIAQDIGDQYAELSSNRAVAQNTP